MYKIVSKSRRFVIIEDEEKEKVHKINLEKMSCDCKGFQFRKSCKHIDFVAKELGLSKKKSRKVKLDSYILDIEKQIQQQFEKILLQGEDYE